MVQMKLRQALGFYAITPYSMSVLNLGMYRNGLWSRFEIPHFEDV